MARRDERWPIPGLGVSVANIDEALRAIYADADAAERRLSVSETRQCQPLLDLLWQAVLAHAQAQQELPARHLRWSAPERT